MVSTVRPLVDLPHLRVLVVDDDEFMLDVVAIYLDQLDVSNVVTCQEGGEVLSRLDAGEAFDIMLVDLNMPKIDGIQVLRGLAARGYTGGIILFSGEDTRILSTVESLGDAHSLNILGSLSKPVDAMELRAKLMRYRPRPARPGVQTRDAVTPEELRNAILAQQIVPFYQPKVRISDGKIVSAEALARWVHPQKGVMLPECFISVAEECGLIDSLMRTIFRQALQHLGLWLNVGHSLSLGLNISTDSLIEVDLPEQIADLAQMFNVPFDHVQLEITETRLMQNLVTSLDVVARLRLKGFGLSIDDFGSGYSSLSQLSKVPFTEMKIDRAFVSGVAEDPAARAILESSAVLAKKLDMTIVAEGVEDQMDWDQVADVGCDFVQGHFVAEAMPADEFSAWVSDWRGGEA